LASNHAGWKFRVEISEVTYACTDGKRDFLENGDYSFWRGFELSYGLEGKRLKRISGEDSNCFAEDFVTGGLASTEIVIVECGEVVVDEGISVQHFQGCTEIFNSFGMAGWGRRLRGIEISTSDHSGGFHAEDGAEAFAAGEDAVAHGPVDGMGEGVGRGQKAFEGSVGEFDAGR
jgi:hypothetical protein